MKKILTVKNIGDILKKVGTYSERISPFTDATSICYQDEVNKPFNYTYYFVDFAKKDFPDEDLVYTTNTAFCVKFKTVEKLAKLHNINLIWG